MFTIVRTILTSRSYCPEAKDYFARLPNEFDGSRKKIMNRYIKRITDAGFGSIGDGLYIPASTDALNAVVNLLPNGYNLLTVNNPVFTVNRGFMGSGGDNRYLKTGFVPSTANCKFQLNSASIAFWNLTNVIVQISGAGDAGDTTKCSGLGPKFAGGVFGGINSSKTQVSGGANTDSTGFYMVSRVASNATNIYKNATKLATSTTVPNGLTAYELFFNSYNAGGTRTTPQDCIFSFLWFGAGVEDGSKSSELYFATMDCLTDLGTI